MKKGFIKSITSIALSFLTFSSLLAGGLSDPIAAKARVTTGQWEYQGTAVWTPSPTKVTAEYNGGTEAVITTPQNQITFKGHFEFPGKTVAGGTKKTLAASVTAHDRTFDKGYRNVIYYVAATDIEVSDPIKELPYLTKSYGAMFYNVDNPTGDPRITGEIHDDPIDDNNKGRVLDSKKLGWTFPYGVYGGQTMTIWFINWGSNEERGAIGFKYKWRSGTGVEPSNDKVVSVNTTYTGTDPAWVMTSYELHPAGKDTKNYSTGNALYDDTANKRVVAGYKVQNGADSWTDYEIEIKQPASILKQSGENIFNITALGLGGHKGPSTNYIYMSYGKNVASYKDIGSSYMDAYDTSGKEYGHSFYVDGPFDSKNMVYNMPSYLLENNNENDTLTFSFYDWGAPWVVVYNYKWVKTGTVPVVKPKKATVKLSQVKGAKAKATVTKQNGATKYQVRYKIGNAKKWKTVKASTKNAFTIKVSKGKKIHVQARAYNSAGWGAWSKTKSLKTDKK